MEYPYDNDLLFPFSLPPIKVDDYKIININKLNVDELLDLINSNKYHTAQVEYAKYFYSVIMNIYNGFILNEEDEKEYLTKLDELFNKIPEHLRWTI